MSQALHYNLIPTGVPIRVWFSRVFKLGIWCRRVIGDYGADVEFLEILSDFGPSVISAVLRFSGAWGIDDDDSRICGID
tara:strand:- start:93 stop:329 length:237 start_codon:yes stop_codon:yes gene_type:complete